MKTGNYEVIVIWDTGEKNIVQFNDLRKAKEAEHNYKTAFGNQINWIGIREQYN